MEFEKKTPVVEMGVFFANSVLATEVKLELVWVWTKCDRLDLVNALVVNPGFD
jgi:hypothetical protein